MKKVSTKVFFTVMWRGVCQALGWFLRLFGYKRDGKFAKCVWGVFATSIAIIALLLAMGLILIIGEKVYDTCMKRTQLCENPDCTFDTFISRDIHYHNHDDGKGYIYNIHTREKTIRNVAWIAKPTGKDSLVCFSDGKKRGYFNKYTGKVVIEPKYQRAWIFSEGLASVEDEDGFIKFIDGTGKVVLDKKMSYIPDMEGYVFHGGYCVVDTDDGELCGLMDKTGKNVLPMKYSRIYQSGTSDYLVVRKGELMGVLDKHLKPVLPLMDCSLQINDDAINVTMPDHTMRKYDLQGQLINDFYIRDVLMLEYEREDIVYSGEEDEYGEYTESEDNWYRPKATARLRSYIAGDGYEGLMTADGHIVTMPLYKQIDAIGEDLYLCTTINYDRLIVDGKGEVVR